MKLTKSRLGALAVLRQGPARYSNETLITADARHIYWQAADWLIDTGLARRATHDTIEITNAGRNELRAQNPLEFA